MSDNEQKIIFSKNLCRLIHAKHKTQKEIAEAIGVIPQTFNTWCTGQALPRMGKVQALADYFGVQKTDLIENNSCNEEKYYINDETREVAQEISDNKDLALLFDAARDAEPEDLKMVHDMLLRLKKAERGE